MERKDKFKEACFLAVLTLFCFSLSSFRSYYTGSRFFLFLNWNLFLAAIPWVLSSLVIIYSKIQKYNLIVLALLVIWLLFFPNAPYILTDLFHLRARLEIPIWYDLLMILSFAWTGLLYGFLSLRDIEQLLPNTISSSWRILSSISLLFVTSFGIYLGRFLRWNSWDILHTPMALVHDISHRFLHPLEHPNTWGMTILMWLLLNMIYWSFRLMKPQKVIL